MRVLTTKAATHFYDYWRLYILFGLFINELAIASWVGVDSLGPFSRQVIRVLNLAAITWGALTIRYCDVIVANTEFASEFARARGARDA